MLQPLGLWWIILGTAGRRRDVKNSLSELSTYFMPCLPSPASHAVNITGMMSAWTGTTLIYRRWNWDSSPLCSKLPLCLLSACEGMKGSLHIRRHTCMNGFVLPIDIRGQAEKCTALCQEGSLILLVQSGVLPRITELCSKRSGSCYGSVISLEMLDIGFYIILEAFEFCGGVLRLELDDRRCMGARQVAYNRFDTPRPKASTM